MKHIHALVMLSATLGASSAWAQTNILNSTEYRQQADVQLALVFQGIAEGGISRSLRFFGAQGRCEAWYVISEVNQAPTHLDIHPGERLKLAYDCGKDRKYVAGDTQAITWAQDAGSHTQAWLRSDDIKADRGQTWAISNEENLFAPVALQSRE